MLACSEYTVVFKKLKKKTSLDLVCFKFVFSGIPVFSFAKIHSMLKLPKRISIFLKFLFWIVHLESCTLKCIGPKTL